MPPAASFAGRPGGRLGRLGLNTLWLLAGRVVGQGLLFLSILLIARALGEADFGRFAVFSALVAIGNVATTFGLDTLLIREVARAGRADGPLPALALAGQLLLALVWTVALWIWTAAGGQDVEAAAALRVYSLALFPLAFFTVNSALLRAFERMDLFFLAGLAAAAAQTAAAAWVWWWGSGLLPLAWLLLGAHAAGALAAGWLTRAALAPLAFRWDQVVPGRLRAAAAAALPLAVLMLLAVLFQRIGLLVVSLLAGEAAAGQFGAAVRLVEAGKLLPYAFFGALFPRLARRGPADSPAGPILGLAALLLIPLFLAARWAPWLVPALYGPAFSPAARPFALMIWGLLPFIVTLTCATRLVAAGRERPAAWGHGLALLAALCLFPLATARAGLEGAALAFVAVETIQAGLLLLVYRIARPPEGKSRP